MMSYVVRTCCNNITMNTMHKRELDRMELKRRDMLDQMKHVRRSLRRRVRESDNARLAIAGRIDELWEHVTCMDYRLEFVERTSLDRWRDVEPERALDEEKTRLIARIEELQELVKSEREELKNAKIAYGELESLYSQLKAAVTAATSIDDLTWVQI
jgi:hypothetical protein